MKTFSKTFSKCSKSLAVATPFRKTLLNTGVAAFFVALSVILPQVLHLLSPSLAVVLLPMHLPLVLAAMTLDAPLVAAAAVAAVGTSFFLTAMPATAMLPFVAVEVVTLAVAMSLLKKTKLPVVVSFFFAVVASRAMKLLLAVVLTNIAGLATLSVGFLWAITLKGALGVVLELLAVSVFDKLLKSRR